MSKKIDICIEEGCVKRSVRRSLCNAHFLRRSRKGLPLGPTRTERALEFIERCVDSKTEECLVPDFKLGSEYPTMKYEGREVKIGWIVLWKTVGEKPLECYVMRHLCGNSRCCNSKHLQWSTESENMADKAKHGTSPNFKGENNPNAKTTKEQREYIRKNYKKGRGPYDPGNAKILAKELGIAAHLVREIARSKT